MTLKTLASETISDPQFATATCSKSEGKDIMKKAMAVLVLKVKIAILIAPSKMTFFFSVNGMTSEALTSVDGVVLINDLNVTIRLRNRSRAARHGPRSSKQVL